MSIQKAIPAEALAKCQTQSACHVCGHSSLQEVSDEVIRFWVSSDSRAVSRGESIAVCPSCGGVQKQQSKRWHEQIKEIYAQYSIYGNSAGSEQPAFEAASGASQTRSSKLLERLRRAVPLPERGRLLDVGCGNGATLRAFASLFPEWRLIGTELNDKYRETVENIPGVEAMLSVDPPRIDGDFDLVSLVHVLEHIPDPIKYLQILQEKVSGDGYLFIEVPDFECNPFDLIVADHSTHFSPNFLSGIVSSAGYEVLVVARDWVAKEISLVARKQRDPSQTTSLEWKGGFPTPIDLVEKQIKWLAALETLAQGETKKPEFGILGTTIGATWLFAQLDGQVDFFVDENTACAGTLYLGKSVYLPRDVPKGRAVLVGIPQPGSQIVAGRLTQNHPHCRFIQSPQ